MPDGEEFSDYSPLTPQAKKKIFGLNAHGDESDVLAQYRLPETDWPPCHDPSRSPPALDTVRVQSRTRHVHRRVGLRHRAATSTTTATPSTVATSANFAFLIVADADQAIAEVDGVVTVDLALDTHFAADEINAGVAARAGFIASFDGLARTNSTNSVAGSAQGPPRQPGSAGPTLARGRCPPRPPRRDDDGRPPRPRPRTPARAVQTAVRHSDRATTTRSSCIPTA